MKTAEQIIAMSGGIEQIGIGALMTIDLSQMSTEEPVVLIADAKRALNPGSHDRRRRT